jgi:hypothetical protein
VSGNYVQALVTGVETLYAPAPLGVWLVELRFAGRGFLRLSHTDLRAPEVGETWLLTEPQLVSRYKNFPKPVL